MSPIIRKQLKKEWGFQKRTKGWRTYDGAIEQSWRGKVSRIGIRRRRSLLPSIQLARGIVCSCEQDKRRDKKTMRKRKEERKVERDTNEASTQAWPMYFDTSPLSPPGIGNKQPRILAFGNQLDIHKHRQSGRKTEKGMGNGWEVFAADIMLSKGARSSLCANLRLRINNIVAWKVLPVMDSRKGTLSLM